MARVTLQTIAEQVGVSRMTVSNAFSRPDQLSPALRERILATADTLGYVGPDPSARALARGTTGAVGVLLTESLRLRVHRRGRDRLPWRDRRRAGAHRARADVADHVRGRRCHPGPRCRHGRRSRLLVQPDSKATDWLIRRGLPVVFVDQVPAPGIPSVNIDDRGGARAAAQHVVDLGHRRVGIVTSSAIGPYGLLPDPAKVRAAHAPGQRMRGWLEALEPAGITPTVVQETPYANHADNGVVQLLLDADPRPTAILCFSDAIAQHVVHAAQDRGLRVPQDLSVVGFDDNPLAAPDAPTTDHRAPGHRRQGSHRCRCADGRDRARPHGCQGQGQAALAADRAHRPGQHRGTSSS